MSQYKVLPSIAHNFAQTFVRPPQEDADAHLLDDLLGDARKTHESTLRVDVLTGEARPEALVTKQLASALTRYADGFADLVAGHHCDMQFVKAARMDVTFDLAVERAAEEAPGRTESPFVIRVEIDDDRGKTWHAELSGWCAAGRTRAGLLARLIGRA
jgi:hypothetical protein